MRPLTTRIVFEVILGTVLIASLLVIFRQAHRIADLQHRQEADAQSLHLLRDALERKCPESVPPEAMEGTPAGSDRAAIAKREAVIARLDRELAESRATITDLQTQLSTAKDQNAQALASAQQGFQKQLTDTQAQVQDLQTKLDAALAAADIARQRAAALEAENAQMKTSTDAANTRAADVARIVSNLQDLERRRDVYLTSILRRYRDITAEFRTMGSMMDTSHDPGTSGCSSAALSRIQGAITSAEDDLRQINDLDERSQKLEKQLMKK
jgi:DNA repair exonuclease SbcCD ATPase subunit